MKRLLFLTLTTYLFSNTLTIYNNNLAHLNESREFSLKAGLQTIKFTHLPESLILDSLFLDFNSDTIEVLTQSFYSNPLDNYRLLKANINQEVGFFTKDKKQLSGKLISINPNIIKSSGGYYIVKSSDIIYAKLPKNIENSPYVAWEVKSKKAQKSRVELSYLLNGISWSSSYIIKLKFDSLDLKGWAKISNNTQKEFKNVELNLIAGEVNRAATRVTPRVYRKSLAMAAPVSDAAAIVPKTLSGYYLYSVPNRVTIKSKESKEVLLIDAKDVSYKLYGVAVNRDFGNYGSNKLVFSQVIEFENSKKEHLGLPLPAGIVRVYKDKHYLGSANIKNIANKEKVKVTIGRLFDAVGEKKITKFISKQRYRNVETTYTIKNRGEDSLVLKLKEDIPRYGDKVEFKTSCRGVCIYKNLNAFVREFTITLQPKKSYTFTTEFEVYY